MQNQSILHTIKNQLEIYRIIWRDTEGYKSKTYQRVCLKTQSGCTFCISISSLRLVKPQFK
jgi:hypothetical protein